VKDLNIVLPPPQPSMPPSTKAKSLPRIALAGDSGASSVLSHAAAALLPFFSTWEACALRLVCREFCGAVSAHPWMDSETVIKGSLGKWRACFPRAKAANVRNCVEDMMSEVRNKPVVNADFKHLVGMHKLVMAGCRNVTGAAFSRLRGIHTLDMSFCGQEGITDAAFAHLKGIHTLDMRLCEQDTITDAAFAHLRGIHNLNMNGCSQETITDAAFAHLAGSTL
jgi:hypothetical protein